ncbi:MAG TPA: thiamine phosphate synthase [Kofleriaceae bacterium]|nr:thiamine phosphate synthase [Kofleriaceae bacterium]
MSARVVVITDRALCAIPAMRDRLAAILDAVPRGAVRIQIREKDLDGGPLLALALDVIALARPRGAEVWINDRADVAAAAGADGVHLPERGLAIADARALGLRAGSSRHSIEGARAAAAAGAELVHLGPIWSTPSKQGWIEPLGPGVLGNPLGVPIVAVGGIDSIDRAREAARAGASAVAVIRAAWTTDDPARVIAAMCAAVADAHQTPGTSR